MAKKSKKEADEAEETGPVAVNDAWTGMLIISFLALSIGTGFIVYEWAVLYEYGKEPGPVPKYSAPPVPGVKPPDPPPPPPKDDPKDAKKDEKKDAVHLAPRLQNDMQTACFVDAPISRHARLDADKPRRPIA